MKRLDVNIFEMANDIIITVSQKKFESDDIVFDEHIESFFKYFQCRLLLIYLLESKQLDYTADKTGLWIPLEQAEKLLDGLDKLTDKWIELYKIIRSERSTVFTEEEYKTLFDGFINLLSEQYGYDPDFLLKPLPENHICLDMIPISWLFEKNRSPIFMCEISEYPFVKPDAKYTDSRTLRIVAALYHKFGRGNEMTFRQAYKYLIMLLSDYNNYASWNTLPKYFIYYCVRDGSLAAEKRRDKTGKIYYIIQKKDIEEMAAWFNDIARGCNATYCEEYNSIRKKEKNILNAANTKYSTDNAVKKNHPVIELGSSKTKTATYYIDQLGFVSDRHIPHFVSDSGLCVQIDIDDFEKMEKAIYAAGKA